MENNYRVVVIGSDRAISMIRRLSSDLAQDGCDLVAMSSFSLGDNFVVMMIVNTDAEIHELRGLLEPTTEKHQLRLIIDSVKEFDPTHHCPEVSVRLQGRDRVGVFSYCMTILNDAGLEIMSMNSDLLGKPEVGQSSDFLNLIKGRATLGLEELNRAAENLRRNKIDITITDTSK
ncbi:hypothetical protein [Leucothrix arctica]|uniref:Glycine cleavage system transcriptional repressor n=1 Tax=Leucothrix arctica TaxID=1481894 RepID=A0A317CQ39_9GAMM|nr:hypothetical protein [Leucothrix arctica]PWQ98412.1 hypothetical protein DKT75_04625 [Leucothrix arctica]